MNTFDELMGMIVRECAEAGITVSFMNKSSHERSLGLFDSERKKLVVCMNNLDWQYVLLHEYMHFCQWRDDSPIALELSKYPSGIYNRNRYRSMKDKIRHYSLALKQEIDADKKVIDFCDCYPFLKNSIKLDLRGINTYYSTFYYMVEYCGELKDNGKIDNKKIPAFRLLEFDEAWQPREEVRVEFENHSNFCPF